MIPKTVGDVSRAHHTDNCLVDHSILVRCMKAMMTPGESCMSGAPLGHVYPTDLNRGENKAVISVMKRQHKFAFKNIQHT